MEIDKVRESLLKSVEKSDKPRDILKSSELKDLYKVLPTLSEEKRKEFGQKINKLRAEIEKKIKSIEEREMDAKVEPIDITAPMSINQPKPELMTADNGTKHPLMVELSKVVEIFQLMGFDAIESRQLDDEYHMFDSLNFPPNHPARDIYDAFRTEEDLIPPGHTSVMQSRILKSGKDDLEKGKQIAAISYGRVFRNEDQDATHEHTFYQCEGVFVSKTASVSQLIEVLKSFFETYYGENLNVKLQPDYFPFTEPSFQVAIEKPKSLGIGEGWLELLGCGMIHPNVLKSAGIDPKKYRGFAWGFGIERLVMLKYGISDIRYFESGKLQFLKEFK